MKRVDQDRTRTVHLAAFEHLADAVIIVDPKDRIVLFNAAAEALWGRSRETTLGEDIATVVPGFASAPTA
ncbi:MAG: fold, partial [Hyphomicrobiales bacterium]|nr:fold [Hyphomicrobiales bacterium]